jgi:hypothetical protein
MGLGSQRFIFNSYSIKIFYGGYQKHLYGERTMGVASENVKKNLWRPPEEL